MDDKPTTGKKPKTRKLLGIGQRVLLPDNAQGEIISFVRGSCTYRKDAKGKQIYEPNKVMIREDNGPMHYLEEHEVRLLEEPNEG